MSRNIFSKYIWIIDTIRRHGRISRRELDSLWRRSSFSEGEGLPRRTFYNYRAAIEQLFGITIMCDPETFEYYIGDQEIAGGGNVTDWMLNSAAMTNLLADSRDVSDLIFLEDVPSAREFLSPVTRALKERLRVKFDYQPYTRSVAKTVIVEPYFLKIFRQRWYLTGFNVRDKAIKTYALDRIANLQLQAETYRIPDDFDASTYFRDSFGIVFNQGQTKDVVLQVDPQQAKYFRALPLHHSQTETIGEGGASLFHYRLKLTFDFVEELLSHGSKVTVINPPELRAIMVDSLKSALANYQ